MKEGYMKSRYLALIITGTMLLGACATSGDEEVAPAAPVGAGAIVGTVAADRDGDGMVDGYYTSDGIYHAFQAPPCPPPPPPPPRSEEHTSELQSLMRMSYAVFRMTKKNNITTVHHQ